MIGRSSGSITVGQKNEMKRENETEGKTFGIFVLIFRGVIKGGGKKL